MTSILVVGSGALGAYYAGRLSQSGAEVSVVCRSDYEVVKEDGYQIESPLGDFHFKPKHVLRHASDMPEQPDIVMVTTKVYPSINGAELIKPVIQPDTMIVLLQNGIFIEKPYLEAYPNNPLVSGLAYLGSLRPNPGHVRHQSGGHVSLGLVGGGEHPQLTHLAELFDQAGHACTLSNAIQGERWKKMVWNAPFNPMSVIGNHATTDDIIDLANPLLRAVMAEVLLIAEHEGYPIPADFPEKMISYTRDMGAYKSSMLQDFEAGRPLEIDAILGNMIRYAKAEKLSIPHSESLYNLLKLVSRS